jgi:hypothetical protein
MKKFLIISLFSLFSCEIDKNKVNLRKEGQDKILIGIRYSDNTTDTVTVKKYQVEQLELKFQMLYLEDKIVAYDVRRFYVIGKKEIPL